MEAYDSRLVCSAAFAVLLGAILMLAAVPPQFAVLLLEVGLLGIGINAAQAITYSIAPAIYAPQIRATGVGMAVAAARLGGIAGPLLATALVDIGWQTGGIFLGVIPIAAISCICILLLLPATRQAVKARAQA